MIRWVSLIVLVGILGMLEIGLALAVFEGTREGSVVYVNWVRGAELLIVPVAWIFSVRKKRLVMFLRHFGDTTANESLMQSLYGALRPYARAVVLDDSEFQPVSVPMRERIIVTGLVAMICVNIIGVIVVGVATNTPVERSGARFDFEADAFVTVVQPGRTSEIHLGIWLTSTSVLIINGYHSVDTEGFIVLVGAPDGFFDEIPTQSTSASWSQSIPLWIMVGVLAVLGYRTSFRSWEAMGAVQTASELPAVLRGLKTLRWRLRAPRSLGTLATVIKTNDLLWRSVVEALLKETDWVVLDCSNPTESVLWEFRLVLRAAPERLIVMRSRGVAPDPAEPLAQEISSLLTGMPNERVLEYDDANKKELGRQLAAIVRAKR